MSNKLKHAIKVLLGKDLYVICDTYIHTCTLGTAYGGWTFCDKDKPKIIYSFGIGEDISWDLAMIEKYGCDVYAFDPTPKSLEWLTKQELPEKFHYYGYGVAEYDGSITLSKPKNPEHVSLHRYGDDTEATIEVPVNKVETIIKELGHQSMQVDILKMDIEGCEYEVIPDLFKSGIFPGQILVEFHHRLNGVGVGKTKETIKILRDNGYALFNISDRYEEYSFIKRSALE